MLVRTVLAGLVCWLLAALHYCWLVPELLRLPADYASEAQFNAVTRARQSPTGAWTASSLVARRVDQVLVSSASHAIIQGDLHWTNAAGAIEYETSAIFGVDRYTRQNLPGYGDTVRNGPYLFPLHTQKKSYRYWDPQFIGQCDATFERSVVIEGTELYVFRFSASKLDETVGYAHLPDVPERYKVLTDAGGTLWIEPDSGIVVDYDEQGVSYLARPADGARVADVYIWKDRYSGHTRAARMKAARAERRRMFVLERAIPLALLVAGAGIFALALWRRRRSPAGGAPAPAAPVPA